MKILVVANHRLGGILVLFAQLAERYGVSYSLSMLLISTCAWARRARRDWLLFGSSRAIWSEEMVEMRSHQIFKVVAIEIYDMFNFKIASVAKLGKTGWILLFDSIENELLTALTVVN